MEYTHLGRTGLTVSRLCLGTMNFGPQTSEADSFAIMDQALEQGINFFDTANMYSNGSSEEILGRALKDFISRQNVVIATGPLESYEILPGDTGIAELMRAGSIVSRPRQSFVGPDNQPLKMASPYRGNFFEIVKPIPRFPAGLSGQDAVTFVLADGVPMPGGNPGMSCVLDGKTGQPLNESPICRRRR